MASSRKLTKAERHELSLRAALSWPTVDTPEPLSKEACVSLVENSPTGYVRAWTYNVGRREVMLGGFDQYNHNNDGPMRKGQIASQGLGGPWFATREDACVALRAKTTRQVADMLLTLDERIANMLSRDLPADAPDAVAEATGPSR